MPTVRTPRVLAHLVREEANAVQLYLQYKGYHWNVAGPLFRDLHLLFDEHAKEVFETIDPLAERQRVLGAAAPYRSEDLRAASSLPPEHGLPDTPREMVDRLLAAHRVVIDGMREGFKAAELDGDPGSADLFARFVQAHEKMGWFLRELAAPVRAPTEESGTLAAFGESGSVLAPSHARYGSAPLPGRRSNT
jgi:starvation-inducible DNA-binding protein